MLPFALADWQIEGLGFLAAGLVFLTFCMRTMLTLRLVAVASNLAFLLYALAAGLLPVAVLHGALLPLNLARLVQMERQVRRARATRNQSLCDQRFDWLIPQSVEIRLDAGETLFSRGDPANALYVVIEGRMAVPEAGVELGPGALLGEISLFSRERRRTASARAVGPVRLGMLSERRVLELHYDNPQFADELARVITQRLIENLRRAERGRAREGA